MKHALLEFLRSDSGSGSRLRSGGMESNSKRRLHSFSMSACLTFATLAVNVKAEPPSDNVKIPGPVTAVKTHQQLPIFIIDGKPFLEPVFETYVPEEKYFSQFAAAGTRLFNFAANLGEGFGPPVWVAPDKFDFSVLDERAHTVIRADPDALIMPRILMTTPDWWREQNPEELLVLDDGQKTFKAPTGTPVRPNRTYESIASEKWRQDMATGLRRIIEHMQQSDYADHVFGYLITGMMTEEWYHWSSACKQLGDYSQPNLLRFRRWVKAKYGTVENLRLAWANPSLDFDSVVVPSLAQRKGEPSRTFRDPVREMQVIDYYLFYNELIPETIDFFAKTAKETSRRQKVVGSYYGYMFEFAGSPDYGHNALGKYLQSPNIDFMIVTASYYNHHLGSGGDYPRSPAASVALHGKLWFHDNDSISYLYRKIMKRIGYTPEQISTEGSFRGAADNPEESIWAFRRTAGFTLGHGMYQSFFDLHGGYYDDPKLMEEVKLENNLFQQAAQYNRSSISEILIVSDEASCYYVAYPENYGANDFSHKLLIQNLVDSQPGVFQLGAPTDSVLVDDLSQVNTEQYKFIIILNCYHLTDNQRELIWKKVQQKGKTVLWCYAAGLFNGAQCSPEAMSELIGMKITVPWGDKLISPAIEVKPGESPLALELQKAGLQLLATSSRGRKKEAYSFMKDGKIGVIAAGRSCQLLAINDPAATVLGTMPGTTEATLAVKRVADWTSIYSITAALPPAFFRAVARTAGVHIYNDADDTLYASQSYLTICANKSGKRTIHFPTRCDVYDALTGNLLYHGVDRVSKEMRDKETLLFRYSPRP